MTCASYSSSYESSGAVTTGQRYLLKWSIPLEKVEVIEYSSSEGQGDNCRFPPQHSAENVVINSKPSKCQEFLALRDFSLYEFQWATESKGKYFLHWDFCKVNSNAALGNSNS